MWAAPLVGGWSRRTGAGSGNQISGRVALWIDPELPARLAVGRTVVLVSATNGKTTVVTLLAEALRATGRRVASNADGANLLPG
jgi:UDP-N-acetylmuramoylalanine-D-glutamate ligase